VPLCIGDAVLGNGEFLAGDIAEDIGKLDGVDGPAADTAVADARPWPRSGPSPPHMAARRPARASDSTPEAGCEPEVVETNARELSLRCNKGLSSGAQGNNAHRASLIRAGLGSGLEFLGGATAALAASSAEGTESEDTLALDDHGLNGSSITDADAEGLNVDNFAFVWSTDTQAEPKSPTMATIFSPLICAAPVLSAIDNFLLRGEVCVDKNGLGCKVALGHKPAKSSGGT